MSAIAARLKLITVDWVQMLMFLLILAGLGVSFYLMWGYTVPDATLACGSSHGCETVKNSVYANLMGIPLPTLGLVSYLSLLVLLLVKNQPAVRNRDWSAFITLAIFGLSLIGVLYSAYLTYIELFVINAICRWCVASALIMVAIFLLSVINLNDKNNQSFVEG